MEDRTSSGFCQHIANGGSFGASTFTFPTPKRWNFCPQCGHKLEAAWRYCAGCGEKIEQPQQSAPWTIPSVRQTVPMIDLTGQTS